MGWLYLQCHNHEDGFIQIHFRNNRILISLFVDAKCTLFIQTKSKHLPQLEGINYNYQDRPIFHSWWFHISLDFDLFSICTRCDIPSFGSGWNWKLTKVDISRIASISELRPSQLFSPFFEYSPLTAAVASNFQALATCLHSFWTFSLFWLYFFKPTLMGLKLATARPGTWLRSDICC